MEIKYFEVSVNRTDPYEGRYIGSEILGHFKNFNCAEAFRDKWIREHQKWDPYGIVYGGRLDTKTGRIIFNVTIKPKVSKLDD